MYVYLQSPLRSYPQAIYPTVIIVLVALNRSHLKDRFMKSSGSQITLGPEALRPLTVVVNATMTTHYDSQPRRNRETVLIIGEQESSCGDSPEHSSTHTVKEQKLDVII